MILRRFMQHIREQNWFAVGLDVIVVIVGIFLGLQVQDWYVEQENIELEQVYLNRLITDMEENVRLFSNSKKNALLKQDWLERIENSIETANISPASNIEFFDGLSHSMIYSDTTAQAFRETYEELQNTGRLILIRNADLRREIATYYRREATQARRMASRITSYEELMFEIVDPKLNLIRRRNEEAYAQEANSLSAQEQEEVINDFLVTANDLDFLRTLNAELNYTRFLIGQYDLLSTWSTELTALLEQRMKSETNP